MSEKDKPLIDQLSNDKKLFEYKPLSPEDEKEFNIYKEFLQKFEQLNSYEESQQLSIEILDHMKTLDRNTKQYRMLRDIVSKLVHWGHI